MARTEQHPRQAHTARSKKVKNQRSDWYNQERHDDVCICIYISNGEFVSLLHRRSFERRTIDLRGLTSLSFSPRSTVLFHQTNWIRSTNSSARHDRALPAISRCFSARDVRLLIRPPDLSIVVLRSSSSWSSRVRSAQALFSSVPVFSVLVHQPVLREKIQLNVTNWFLSSLFVN